MTSSYILASCSQWRSIDDTAYRLHVSGDKWWITDDPASYYLYIYIIGQYYVKVASWLQSPQRYWPDRQHVYLVMSSLRPKRTLTVAKLWAERRVCEVKSGIDWSLVMSSWPGYYIHVNAGDGNPPIASLQCRVVNHADNGRNPERTRA